MKLTEYTVEGFADLLASDAPAPGGGSASALMGALGTGLAHMVGSLTAGRAKYAEHQALVEGLMTEAESIRREFIDLIQRDTEAFNGVSAVFQMPKDTDEEKTARRDAMQKALKACTLTPFQMMELALQGLEITKKAVGKTNPNAASDLGVAALSLKAAAQGAWLNVLINIGGIKDEGFVREYRSKGEAVLKQALPLADEVYQAVEASL